MFEQIYGKPWGLLYPVPGPGWGGSIIGAMICGQASVHGSSSSIFGYCGAIMGNELLRVLQLIVLVPLLVPDIAANGPGSVEAAHGLGVAGKRFTPRVKRTNNTYGSHYFVTLSAIPLRKQTGYYKNTMVSLNTVAYGLTENLSASGSLDLISLIRARDGGPVYTGRIQVCGSTSELFHLGASITFLNARVPVGAPVPEGTPISNGFFTALAMVTLGSKDYQLTLSGGLTHDGQEMGRGPVFNIGGAARVLANVMLVTEHWVFSDPDRGFSAHAAGVRILGEALAIDVGLAYDKEFSTKVTPVGMPFLAATLNF